MKVWFGCTTSKFKDYKDNYFAIRQQLIDQGCIVLFDWLPDAEKRIEESSGGKRNIKYVYQQVITAISEADAVIIEHTVPNFSSAHQINFALLRRKPTLVLRLKKDNENFTDSYIEAIESPFLTIREYNLSNYQGIINEFLGISNIGNEAGRYNIVLSKQQKYYLDWAAGRYHRSRSEIIRKLIDKELATDHEYRKYLSPHSPE